MTFKAFLSSQDDGKVSSRFVQMEEEQLDAGEVTIRVAYSDVNYKDALSATGAGRIIRRFPCVGGIDLSGTVTASRDPRFSPGDQVLCTSYDLGVAHHGGYAELARVPADWVVKLPVGLSLFDAMAYGTAGFTAALAVVRMEQNGLAPANGPVLVTGATGGVGSVATAILARLGYRVVALTGKESETDYLKDLGAAEVMLRSSLDLGRIKPLDKATWAGAVDNLGGPVLAWLASTMQVGGTLASVGLAASADLATTVMPFILRGVSLLGVDSVNCPMPLRAEVWRRLAGDMRPARLEAMTRTIEFSQLPDVFDAFLQARVKGRTVVRINP
ncbi:oxidoreductase [Denitratisoma sp. DHT3]|uniref:oxidoreductase n=1 Tax=Denitratisoma sp. DHT3 TaxID=1981880 RepID=UPI001198A4C4|nr:oxidoreductase [Denitratisoma sp. DHT3]QDX82693.1 oxidoreductase [Denitratisoma sp. DHT3]